MFRATPAPADHGVPIAVWVCVERALTDWPMDTSTHRLERVLCAVTFSPSARRVVAWAALLAGSSDAEVRLFHALPNSEELVSATAEPDSERVLEKLFALARPLPGRPRISAAVTAGDAASEILCHARLIKADLIVVGMRAEDGSVSPLVTRLAVDAPCPVLVVDENSAAPRRSNEIAHILVAPAEFGETTSCVMRFAGKTVLLVPERLSRARGVRRSNRPIDPVDTRYPWKRSL